MLGGLSLTATRSRRNTAPKGGPRRGNWKGIILLYLQDHQGSLSQLDYSGGIIHNWLVRCWVNTALWMCVYDKIITFQNAGWAVFLRIIINALARSLFVTSGWTLQGPVNNLSAFCNSFDKTSQSRCMAKSRNKLEKKNKFMKKNKCLTRFLTLVRHLFFCVYETSNDDSKFPIPCQQREREFIEHVVDRMKKY